MKITPIDYFPSNLYRLKNWINRTCDKEINLILFNYIVDLFPNNRWFSIKENFWQNIEYQEPQWIITYTILAYNLGTNFTTSNLAFIEDLCLTIAKRETSIFKIVKIGEFFLNQQLYPIILKAWEFKNIRPLEIINCILDNFDVSYINQSTKNLICSRINDFVSNYTYQLFDGNYDILNVYQSLNALKEQEIYLDLTNLDKIDKLLDLEPKIKLDDLNKIKHDFAMIESKDVSIKRKVADILTIIDYYTI